MALPDFDDGGELPVGIHAATVEEVVARFGLTSPERQAVTQRWLRIYHLVAATHKLERFVIFGSYVTAKEQPNDVDIILVMRDDFREPDCNEETSRVFRHAQAATEFGASVFWTTPSGIVRGTVDDFLAHWQSKRDLTRRGIVEVVP